MRTLVIPPRNRLLAVEVFDVDPIPEKPRLSVLRRRRAQLSRYRDEFVSEFRSLEANQPFALDEFSLVASLGAFVIESSMIQVQRAQAAGHRFIDLESGPALRRARAHGGTLGASQSRPHLSYVNAEKAWACASGRDVLVGIADAGVSKHQDFKKQIRSYGFATGTDIKPLLNKDPDGHGTMVCGAIAGKSGTAPKAELAFVGLHARLFGPDYYFTRAGLVQALKWLAEHPHRGAGRDVGCDIISLSVVFELADEMWFEPFQTLYEDTKPLVIVAAGNSHPMPIGSPGNYDSVLAVGGTIPTATGDEEWSGSQRGVSYKTGSSKPEIHALAHANTTIGHDQYSHLYGTSFAAPVVAGAAALLLSRNRKLGQDPALFRAQLLSLSRTVTTPAGDQLTVLDLARLCQVTKPPT